MLYSNPEEDTNGTELFGMTVGAAKRWFAAGKLVTRGAVGRSIQGLMRAGQWARRNLCVSPNRKDPR